MNVAETSARRAALLSRADEVALAQRIEGGDLDARETMIESNLRLVRAIARTFRGSGVPSADLVQEGTIGLVYAVEHFDHRRGVKFSTYAGWWIRRSMRDAIAASRAVDPSQTAIEHEQHDDVSAMLRLLPKRHREVLVRRYGLHGSSVQSHKEIGRSLGVGEERGRERHAAGQRAGDVVDDAVRTGARTHRLDRALGVEANAQDRRVEVSRV